MYRGEITPQLPINFSVSCSGAPQLHLWMQGARLVSPPCDFLVGRFNSPASANKHPLNPRGSMIAWCVILDVLYPKTSEHPPHLVPEISSFVSMVVSVECCQYTTWKIALIHGDIYSFTKNGLVLGWRTLPATNYLLLTRFKTKRNTTQPIHPSINNQAVHEKSVFHVTI